MKPRQVLIVEDNPALGDLLRDVLAAFGFNVLVAVNGSEGLAMLATYEVDAVVADVDLPCISGIEFCRAARTQEAALGRDLPVWLMTGSHEPEIECGAAAAGANALLHKPFSIAEVAARLRDEMSARPPAARAKIASGSTSRGGAKERKSARAPVISN